MLANNIGCGDYIFQYHHDHLHHHYHHLQCGPHHHHHPHNYDHLGSGAQVDDQVDFGVKLRPGHQ